MMESSPFAGLSPTEYTLLIVDSVCLPCDGDVMVALDFMGETMSLELGLWMGAGVSSSPFVEVICDLLNDDTSS